MLPERTSEIPAPGADASGVIVAGDRCGAWVMGMDTGNESGALGIVAMWVEFAYCVSINREA